MDRDARQIEAQVPSREGDGKWRSAGTIGLDDKEFEAFNKRLRAEAMKQTKEKKDA